ncbi:MAG: S41 family peptidase [Gemmataceae bacterium]|nr:S41 family peptidase [Gemmataceae bacterium]MDW8264213.1 S41 family peptidase [Gemmataceae bacterium]
MWKAMCVGLLGGWVWTAGLAVPAQAAEPKSATAYVVLVGIDRYKDEQIKPRQHAEADARALHDLLARKEHLNVPREQVKLLVGAQATRDNILKELRWAVGSARSDDLVIFGFFGQGAPLGERTCFLASDSTFKGRDKDAVASADIEHELEKLKSQRFCAFIDVNFKGFDAGKEAVVEPNPMDLYRTFLGNNEEKEDQLPTHGRVVFLATNGLTQSIDLKDHGIFAKVLLDGLSGKADTDGYEPDGIITVDELSEYLSKELPPLARSVGKTREEKEQLPIILGGRLNHFGLTHNPAVMPKVEERLAKLTRMSQQGILKPEWVEEGRRLLSQMPKLKAHQELRKNYQKLVDGTLSAADFAKEREQILTSMKLRRSEALEYAAKVMQAINLVREGYVKELNQGEMVDWAIRGLLRRLEERKLLSEFADRLKLAKSMSERELTLLLADVRERLGKREDLDKNKDVDISLQQMLSHLDPYTNYIDPETLAQVRREMMGRFTGIGIQIRKDLTRDMLMVVSPIKGSPAYHAGVKAGDIITQVRCFEDKEGRPLSKPEIINTKGLPLNEAVKRILGKPGTDVEITVEREKKDGGKEVLDFRITRGTIEVESVLGFQRKEDDSWDYMIDPVNKIGYARLTQFSRNTYRDLKKIVTDLERAGMKGFVLDLRFNPGGLLDSAVRISDLFVDDGLIVSIRPRVGRELSYTGESEGSMLSFPMVCLINGGSASGSEIVAACLQDHKRAIIMGERSYGKGSVQNIQPFEATGGEIKLTTASYWRPSGKNINKSSTKGSEDEDWGVIPDKGYLLKLTPKERDDLAEYQRETEVIPRRDLPPKDPKPEFKDRQLEMALDYLRGQIKTAARSPLKRAG